MPIYVHTNIYVYFATSYLFFWERYIHTYTDIWIYKYVYIYTYIYMWTYIYIYISGNLLHVFWRFAT